MSIVAETPSSDVLGRLLPLPQPPASGDIDQLRYEFLRGIDAMWLVDHCRQLMNSTAERISRSLHRLHEQRHQQLPPLHSDTAAALHNVRRQRLDQRRPGAFHRPFPLRQRGAAAAAAFGVVADPAPRPRDVYEPVWLPVDRTAHEPSQSRDQIFWLNSSEDVVVPVDGGDRKLGSWFSTGAMPAAPPPPPLSCLLYTSPSPRDRQKSRMPSSA